MNIYRLLEIPLVYRTAQATLAPGMDRLATERLSEAFAQIPASETVLDVGCGPSSWLWKFGMKPVGLDLCHAYTRKFRATGSHSVTASAALLPFASDSFSLVFSYGLLHHLPDDIAAETVREIVRVTRSGGHAVLFDPVLPNAASFRPQAWALCKLDRGKFIRSQSDYESRVLGSANWKTSRFRHSYLGTEGILSVLRKSSLNNGVTSQHQWPVGE
jgi:SAM-dependent methyltransferase